ncbi:VanZ family protein [Nocardia sp. NPDC050710]|uniref:VanZ family protein n=1 Tax=Nocardia sp. NPDC050710 TaxID=3157220 RepID=UPI0033D10834
MRQVWDSWGDVLVAWTLAVPLVVIAAGWLVRLRIGRGQPRGEALRSTIAELGILLGTLPWVWMILTPVHGERHVILLPLKDLIETLADASTNTVVQVGANLVLFVPLGFFLPLRFPRFAGVLRMMSVGAALSAALEIAQYVLDLGRYSSIDDVLMNAAGAGIGAYLARVHVARREAERSYSSRVLLRLGWSS